jgi:pre-mRNA-splicing factor ATP-dependent RNA helicase DHX16
MRSCFPLQPEWLAEVAPHYYKSKDVEALGVDRKMPKGQGAAESRL